MKAVSSALCGFVLIFTGFCCSVNAIDYVLNVDTSKILSTTEDEYLSICLDPYLKHDPGFPWHLLDFNNPKLHTLLRGLSPAILRFGGTDADWSVFYNVTSLDTQQTIFKMTSAMTDQGSHSFVVPFFPQDIDHLISLAQSAGGKLLFDLNMQKRLGSMWDSTNALQLMTYLAETQQTDKVFFELGNEPNYPDLTIDGERMAKDFQILRRVMDAMPQFSKTRLVGADFNKISGNVANKFQARREKSLLKQSGNDIDSLFDNSEKTIKTVNDALRFKSHAKVQNDNSDGKIRLVGADIGMADVEFLTTILQDFVKYAAHTVDAVTIHHYYFRGPGANLDQFYDLKYFNAYTEILTKWRDIIYKAAGFKIPVWVGETSDSYSYGSPNITNRYISGFLWLDKLGISAKLGIKLVARQDLFGGNYPLLDMDLSPNPDYWLSHVFKQLVSTHVLNVSITSADKSAEYLRAYAHGNCVANKMTNFTIFALNLSPDSSATIRFNEEFNDEMKVYAMTPGSGGLLSQTVLLNGQPMKLIDDHTLPVLNPKVEKTTSGYSMPPLTFAFFVFDVNKMVPC